MIRLTYSDGTTEVIGTDQTWQTTPGPVIRNNIYLGEIYDARNEVENWAYANTGGNGKTAVLTRGPEGVHQEQMNPPVGERKILQTREEERRVGREDVSRRKDR